MPRRDVPGLTTTSPAMPALPCRTETYHATPYLAQPRLDSPCHATPDETSPALPRPALPRLAAPCRAAPCLASRALPNHAEPGRDLPRRTLPCGPGSRTQAKTVTALDTYATAAMSAATMSMNAW